MKRIILFLFLFIFLVSFKSFGTRKYVLYSASWSNKSDLDADLYNGQATFTFDLDYGDDAIFFPTTYADITVKIYAKQKSSPYSEYFKGEVVYRINNSFNLTAGSITHQADAKSILVRNLDKATYEFRLEIWELSGICPICSWNLFATFSKTNDSNLDSQKF
jgi:hypothetical protein